MATGLFDEMIAAVAALAQRGVDRFLRDTDHCVICSGVRDTHLFPRPGECPSLAC